MTDWYDAGIAAAELLPPPPPGDDLSDPDDAYDAGDPVLVRLTNLDRRLLYVIVRIAAAVDPSEVAARVARILDDLRTIRAELEL